MDRILPRLALFFSSFLLLSLISPAITEAAFGISPPFLNADHLVKGASYVQTLYLVQDQPSEDLKIHADLKIADSIRSWISIDKGFDFVIPKGVRQFPVNVTVAVPKDASLGAYNGTLSFVGAPAQAGQVTIALGVQAAINLTVGEGVFRKISVPLIKILDIEEGWNPRVYVKFENDGNVPESLDGATFELYDQFNSVRLAYVQKSSDFSETPPFSIKEYTLDFPTDFHVGIGQYWGTVTLYQNQKVVATEKAVFNVLKAGSLSSPGALIVQNIKNNFGYYLGGAAILAFILFFYKKRQKRRGSV